MDFKFFIEQLIDRLHLMLLQEVGVEKREAQIPFSLLEIEKLFEILTQAYQETKTAVLAQMPLELAILEWGEDNAQVVSVEEVQEDSAPIQSAPNLPKKAQEPVSKSNQENEAPVDPNALKEGLFHPDANLKVSFYNKLIDQVKLQNHLVAGVLRGCLAEEIVNDKLKIIARSKFHKEKLEETKTIKLLEECADKIMGKNISVQITLQPA
jgi:hypothetical protein